ncbi:MAG: dihydrolipoyl dehydrogenase family protein [Acidimicrobiales bacterium]
MRNGYRAYVLRENYPPTGSDIHEPAPTETVDEGQPSSERFDIVILGGGSAAEELCNALAEPRADHLVALRVAVVEEDLVGGICPFRACMPSKALLRSAAVRGLFSEASGIGATTERVELGTRAADYELAIERRDLVVEGRDDTEHAKELQRLGVELVRGTGEIRGPGHLAVTGRDGQSQELRWSTLVIATGSRPGRPDIEGLDTVPTWTSDEALASSELPSTLAILGGGPVGCELAQLYASFLAKACGRAGAEATENTPRKGQAPVVVIEQSPRLISREEPELGEALAAYLVRGGVDVRTGVKVERAEPKGAGATLHLSDGSAVSVARVVIATGRFPATNGLGLERIGIKADASSGALRVDEHCAVIGAKDNRVFAAGDVNGLAPFTHAGKYQGRVIAAVIGGEDRRADHRAIPRCIYTSPPVAAVGMTRIDAEKAGIDAAAATMDLTETARAQSDGLLVGTPRPETANVTGAGSMAAAITGTLVLVADRKRRVVIGASAFGPSADEWISEMTLAIRAAVPLDILTDVVHPFPTYAEALGAGLRDLSRQCTS